MNIVCLLRILFEKPQQVAKTEDANDDNLAQLFTEDGEFNVDGQRCDNYIMCPLRPIGEETCPHDFIRSAQPTKAFSSVIPLRITTMVFWTKINVNRVYDGNSESAVVIGTFCGIGRFPFSIVGTGTDLLLEFVSSAAGKLKDIGPLPITELSEEFIVRCGL